MRGSVADLNSQASEQALPEELSQELRTLLVLSTHRIEKTRDIAFKYLNRLIMSFPSLMCDPPLVLAILEVLTMMSRACEDEFTDEVSLRSANKSPLMITPCSSILFTSFTPAAQISLFISVIATRFGTMSWLYSSAIHGIGSSLLWVVRPSNFKPLCRSIWPLVNQRP
jgi:hypothetical protein